jgi:hypothetical protein
MVRLSPETHGTEIKLQARSGSLVLQTAAGEQVLGSAAPERLELSAVGGSARIAQITVRDEAGEVLLHRDYRRTGVAKRTLRHGMLIGALLGLCFAVVLPPLGRLRGLITGLILLLPPGAVLLCPADAWLPCLERLYLVDWAPAQLAWVTLQISLVPVGMAAVAAVCRPVWLRSGPAPGLLLGLWAVLLVASIGLHAEPSPWMAAAVIWAVLPMWLVREDPDSSRVFLALDLAALGAVAVLGLGMGLLLATLWRMSVVVGGAGVLASRAARPAMNLLFVLFLAVLPAAESALQHSPLEATWDPTQLQEERPSERGWRDPLSSWVGRCGPEDAAQTRQILVAGGSSAGGAYQYKDDPDASFVAQMHLKLCASLPPGIALQTHNYGRGNRDTFTISRTIEAMLDKSEADLVLLYVGVNDLLADQYPMSRKEREQARSERNLALQGAAGLARRLRMVTGLWLASRALPDKDAPSVPDVPLADATENFETIASATSARGGRLVLMTEHMRREQYARLDPYRKVQQAAAAGRDDADFLDVRPAFAGATDEEMLVDQNHLTREGGARLGALLAATLRPALFSQGSSR